MALVVQKFGGSSVGTVEKIKHVAERVAKRRAQGVELVVVVSAMQGETDRLLGLAESTAQGPDPREVDQLLTTGEQVAAALLAIALKNKGVAARSLNAWQMRLRTDSAHTRARIRSLDSDTVKKALKAGEVVVATGFQGIDDKGNLTTLGRGGSDTSAVAIAAALDADECEIYTDVLGVYTADPNICPSARKLDEIAFDEMLEMASQGSKVLQIRSVELGMNHNVPIRVRSTFSDDPGTLVRGENKNESEDVLERMVVRGVSHNKNEAKLTLRGVPDSPGIAAKIFAPLAEAHVNVDVIVQNISQDGLTDLSFTVPRTDRRVSEEIIARVAQEIGARGVDINDNVAKVSIVGVGMRSYPGVAATMFRALAEANINIQMITTSEIKVTCVIEPKDVERAVVALHDAFELGKAPAKVVAAAVAAEKSGGKAAAKATGSAKAKAKSRSSAKSSAKSQAKPAAKSTRKAGTGKR